MGKLELDEMLERVKEVDRLIKSNIDLIPIDNWGFDETIKEKMRDRKHQIVNSRLSVEDKAKLSNASKQLLARELGGTFQTVSEIFEWLRQTSTNVKPKKRKSKMESSEDLAKTTEKKDDIKPPLKRLKISPKEEDETSKVTPSEKTNLKRNKLLSSGDLSASEESEIAKSNAHFQQESAEKQKVKSKDEKNFDAKRKRADVIVPETAEVLKPNKQLADFLVSTDRASAMQKLQAKIEQYRALRTKDKTPQQFEENKRLKRRLSKMKLKERRRINKQGSNKIQSEGEVKAVLQRPKNGTSDNLGVVNSAANDPTKIIYSKFDFIVKDEPEKLTKKDKRDQFKGKNYKSLLEKVEKRKERLEAVREKNPEKAKRIEENILWTKALIRAEGKKVKDNPELLKKGVKKKEHMKERSKNKWEERISSIKRKQQQKQEKRKSNIQMRKDVKKKKKLERFRKRGRIL